MGIFYKSRTIRRCADMEGHPVVNPLGLINSVVLSFVCTCAVCTHTYDRMDNFTLGETGHLGYWLDVDSVCLVCAHHAHRSDDGSVGRCVEEHVWCLRALRTSSTTATTKTRMVLMFHPG